MPGVYYARSSVWCVPDRSQSSETMASGIDRLTLDSGFLPSIHGIADKPSPPRSQDEQEVMSESTQEFFTIAQAATLLACSPKQVGRLIRAGRLAAVDIGTGRSREFRIARDAIYALSRTSSPSTTSLLPKRRGPRAV